LAYTGVEDETIFSNGFENIDPVIAKRQGRKHPSFINFPTEK